MNIQATLVIVLLIALVSLGVRAEWRATTTAAEAALSASPASTATPSDQAEFSVTPVSDGQYVMRANDKIFYCVNNRCTGIQLVTTPQSDTRPSGSAQPQTPES